ncbi:MAG: hypothetical protein E6G96_04640 [Alphaproteobacteria bacterium]|nr:MAG: hypothetical protein E6G96_04640 [Alphaproteobacteria bacterium]
MVTATYEVDTINSRKNSGLPLNVLAIELLEIGAGGGSIADSKMGLITVGPQSAGAVPGPVCYGAGGTRSTVTDANLLLGYLNADYFNGGAMTLDCAAAAAAVEAAIAKPLGLSLTAAAWGIHSIANSNMERAMRVVSIERGRDPREHVLVAFGGAGPVHACRLARALGIPKVIVPFAAGVGLCRRASRRGAQGRCRHHPRHQAWWRRTKRDSGPPRRAGATHAAASGAARPRGPACDLA